MYRYDEGSGDGVRVADIDEGLGAEDVGAAEDEETIDDAGETERSNNVGASGASSSEEEESATFSVDLYPRREKKDILS